MSDLQEERLNIANHLLATKSVYVNFEERFKLTSGRLSPVYVDCRRLISYPEIMQGITETFETLLKEDIELENVDMIAGGATAGIPFASFLAKDLCIPLIYVRKKPKGHGSHAQIEGVLKEGAQVVLVEDLITNGHSKLKFKEGIERAGGVLRNVLCVFEYKSEEASLSLGRQVLNEQGIHLYSLINWDLLLRVGLDKGNISHQEKEGIIEFLKTTS